MCIGPGFDKHIALQIADIQQLPFPDKTFDKVVIEAVTMFIQREQDAREVVRVCKMGGCVVDHEFSWRTSPPADLPDSFATRGSTLLGSFLPRSRTPPSFGS
jgi:ubiquinone/menaquinone biosynthesis C-methylase UbiE